MCVCDSVGCVGVTFSVCICCVCFLLYALVHIHSSACIYMNEFSYLQGLFKPSKIYHT